VHHPKQPGVLCKTSNATYQTVYSKQAVNHKLQTRTMLCH